MPYADPERKRQQSRAHYQRTKERRRETADAWRARNKDRVREVAAAWHQRNKEHVSARTATNYRKRLAASRAAFPSPPAVCECCGLPPSGKTPQSSKLHFDHCHVTGKFRGWLCMYCNLTLGLMNDSVERLASAIKYLERAHGS